MEFCSIFIINTKHFLKGYCKRSTRRIEDYKRSFIPFLLTFSLLTSILGCKNKHQEETSESAIYGSENYSDLQIDTTALQTFFKQNLASDSVQLKVIQFYSKREFHNAWLSSDGLSLAAINFYEQMQSDSKTFLDNSLNSKSLDSLFKLAKANEKDFFKNTKNAENLDILLTFTFFNYADKVYGGVTASTRSLDWFIPRKKKSYLKVLESLVSNNSTIGFQEPVNEYYTRLKEKLKSYRIIQQMGGFPEINLDNNILKLGDSSIYILPIKTHLALTSDIRINDYSAIFTIDLKNALYNFQHRMGLAENGKIDSPTLKELNQTVDFRIKQIMLNLERLRWVPVEMEEDYLLVNIPEFRLHVFENRKQIWQTNVVVGKAARRTSIFRGNINTVVLNPYWGIPSRITREEIIPKSKRNSNYLARNGIEVINGFYRQKPSPNNALGKMKFLFPNNYSIYLHDTPAKSLFKENARAFSHGCIRVENPQKLVFHLLRNNKDWPESRINKVLSTNVNTYVDIDPTVPVYIAYFTAWVDNAGQLNFRDDIYNLDSKLSKEVF
jgi:L,D-transpeptidase YcbB